MALAVLPADGQNRPAKPANATQSGGLDGTGVVAYDPPGAADEMIVVPLGNWVGNVFDTRLGNPLETGSVTQLAFVNGNAGGTFPVWGVWNAAGTAPVSTASGSGIVPFTYNTVAMGVVSIGPGFLAGVKVGATFTSCADSVGARSATTQGMGFHGASFGGGVSPIANRNAQVRVAGSVWVVPVELMTFEVSK